MTTTNDTERTVDYLEVDAPINGQQYCCLSFVEPVKDRLAHKESFFFHKFIEHYGHILYLQFCKHHNVSPDNKLKIEFEELYERYSDFKSMKYEEVNQEYDKEVDNETHIRAVKIRGSYPNENVAKSHAKKLRERDPSFDVFVGQVGYWIPFNPININDIEPEYLEEKMQQLVKGHLDNEKLKEDLFDQRRMSMLDQIKVETKTEHDMLVENKEPEPLVEKPIKRKVKKELPPELKTKLQEQMKMFQTNEDDVRSVSIQPESETKLSDE